VVPEFDAHPVLEPPDLGEHRVERPPVGPAGRHALHVDRERVGGHHVRGDADRVAGALAERPHRRGERVARVPLAGDGAGARDVGDHVRRLDGEHGIEVPARRDGVLGREDARRVRVIRGGQVATDGLGSLSARDRQWIPPLSEIRTDNADYRQWLQDIYSGHSNHGVSDGFETFLQAQVLWDETMAAGIAEFVQRHPGTQVVVLAGQGHILFGYGIPDRVQRRLGDRLVQRSVLLNPNPETRAEADVADYFWINQTNDCKNSSREI